MAEPSFFVGVIGNIISILMFLSPVPTFWKIKKHRSTEDFSSLPYICTLLNCSLWTYYGIIKAGEYLVATVNGFGIVVETIYIILFLIYAPKGVRAKACILALLLDVGILAAAIVITQIALHGEARSGAVGIMGAGLNIVMYSSPLSVMKTVVTTKSVKYMPFFLSFFFFLNGGVWLLYAILVRDVILGVPNGTGFFLGAMQLGLYAIYRDGSKRVSNNRLEEGLQHEPLMSQSNNESHQKEEERPI
ncbi:bidirectional sugar transporter SWEET17 [Cajanus cajan]|uniref:bidirectional sugar transporter SWEET17 n=1 Tax=Cajanus cajan TaxID=3821 RepID=UPI00098D8F8E|nr:bidirectional sugar transporter SWEET17 [Cajanus cajan]